MATLVPRNRYGYRPAMRPVNDFYTMLDDFFSTPLGTDIQQVIPGGNVFKMDVQETDDAYVIEADMPGVSRDEIDVELNEGRLSISVEKKVEEEEDEKNYLHRERLAYSASRGVFLKDADVSGVSASLKDGVLTVNVPKMKEDANVTKISID